MTDESILKDLEQDAQIIKERMPTAMGSETAKETAAMLARFMQAEKLNQNSVAKKLGVSSTMVSQFLAGKYAGRLDELTNKIINLINTTGMRRRQFKPTGVVETTVAKQIAAVIKQTEAFCDEYEGKIGLIIGDSGHGKTVCLREYAGANRNSILVELDDTMSSTRLFGMICKALQLDPFGLLPGITHRLVEYLEYREMTVMLDEAAGLTVRQLNQLRQVIVVKGRCPLILAGNRALLKTITAPAAWRGRESLDQFASRLTYVLDLDRAAAKPGGGGVYTPEDIRKLYEYGGVRLTADAVEELRKICKTPESGRMHTAKVIIGALHLTKKVRKEKVISAVTIAWAIGELNLLRKDRLPLATGRAEDETERETAARAG